MNYSILLFILILFSCNEMIFFSFDYFLFNLVYFGFIYINYYFINIILFILINSEKKMEITFRQFQLENKNDQSECYDRKRANQSELRISCNSILIGQKV